MFLRDVCVYSVHSGRAIESIPRTRAQRDKTPVKEYRKTRGEGAYGLMFTQREFPSSSRKL